MFQAFYLPILLKEVLLQQLGQNICGIALIIRECRPGREHRYFFVLSKNQWDALVAVGYGASQEYRTCSVRGRLVLVVTVPAQSGWSDDVKRAREGITVLIMILML